MSTARAAKTSRPGGPVRVRGLTKAFGDRTVLQDLDLDVEAGELVALLGRSGSGKSTLLRTLGGLDPIQPPGRVEIGEVAIAFQEPRLLPWRKVWRNVLVGVEGTASGRSTGETRDRGVSRDRAVALLDEVGLAERADAWPLTLSGGEAQRVSLARALVREPDVLLLDEPFGALDALTRLSMHRLVQRLRDLHGHTILLVTHDVDEAITLADRILVLADGHIAAERDGHDTDRADLRQLLLRDLGVE